MSYQFQSDISVETMHTCYNILEHYAPQEKVNEKRYWPLFKEWFTDFISVFIKQYDFADLMAMVAVENPQPRIGTVLKYGIMSYFDKSITSSFKYMEGCNLFATMNRELSNLNGYDAVVMFHDFFKNIDSYSWMKLADEIRIISSFYPNFAEFAGIFGCTKIPRNQLSTFLRIENYYTATEGRTNLHSASIHDVRVAYRTFVREHGNFNNGETEKPYMVEKTRENEKGKQHKAKEKYRRKKIVACSKCNKKGHFSKDCWSTEINCIV